MNIILVQYEREKEWTTGNLQHYYRYSWKFYDLMIKQLNRVYEKPRIHVLTNRKLEPKPNVIYHIDEGIEQSNYAKLYVFGLLDEPAMYIDNDILINRPFEAKHMPDVPFNIFQPYHSQNQHSLPERMRCYPHFNTGIIWIGQPSNVLMHEIMFYRDLFRNYPEWVNDEFPISYYIMKKKLEMQLDPSVNQYREDVNTKEERDKCQSVHYTGKEFKDLLVPEYMKRWKIME
jgi:hypothetical protein